MSSWLIFLLACTGIEKESVRLADTATESATLAPDRDGDGSADVEDCAPDDAAVYPGASEFCDGADQDCDGVADDDPKDAVGQWPDGDGDGYGDMLGVSMTTCDLLVGYTTNNLDCDDADATINPDEVEVCDARDNDCDLTVDEEVAELPDWFPDDDGDGYGGDAQVTTACTAPEGYVAEGLDCDDARADIHPGAAEVCDGVDNNCDTIVDQYVLEGEIYCQDADADGWGDSSQCRAFCALEAGWSEVSGDCSDIDAAINPGMPESCNSFDDNCDGIIDEDATDMPSWYADFDGDGFGSDATAVATCDQPPNLIAAGGDCNDVIAVIYPGAAERCNGVDDDCDGALWSEETDDNDGDGFANCFDATP